MENFKRFDWFMAIGAILMYAALASESVASVAGSFGHGFVTLLFAFVCGYLGYRLKK